MRNKTELKEFKVTTPSGYLYHFYQTNNASNGEPQYFVHWHELGLQCYQADNITKLANLRIAPKARQFGGGFVFKSFNIELDAKRFERLGLHAKKEFTL